MYNTMAVKQCCKSIKLHFSYTVSPESDITKRDITQIFVPTNQSKCACSLRVKVYLLSAQVQLVLHL